MDRDSMMAEMVAACGTDLLGYISEAPGLSSFVKDGGAVYLASAYREPYGPRFLLGYRQVLERTAKGYDDSMILRRYDEY